MDAGCTEDPTMDRLACAASSMRARSVLVLVVDDDEAPSWVVEEDAGAVDNWRRRRPRGRLSKMFPPPRSNNKAFGSACWLLALLPNAGLRKDVRQLPLQARVRRRKRFPGIITDTTRKHPQTCEKRGGWRTLMDRLIGLCKIDRSSLQSKCG